MALPKLMLLVPVSAGHLEVLCGAVPVISDLRQSKVIPRFLLTWAAATHWPMFLNPVHACDAGSPVSVWILSPIAGFLSRMLASVAWCVDPDLPLFAPPALP